MATGMAESKAHLAEVDDSNYDKLEQQFEEVLQDLVGDKSLQRFRVEYEKLFRTLKKSHGNEKRLVKKCRELNAEIVANAAKVQTALKLSEEDQMTISSLKKEVEKAWKMVDASHEKEARAKETISQLKLEIANLTSLVEQGAGISLGEESTVNDLLRQKEELVKELDQKSEKIMQQQAEISEAQEKLQSLEQSNSQLEAELDSMRQTIDLKKAEADREHHRRERLEKEARDLKSAIEQRTNEVKQKTIQLEGSEEQQAKLREMLATARSSKDKLQKEFAQSTDKVAKIQSDLEEQIHQNATLLAENGQKQISIKAKDEEIAVAKAETGRISKIQAQTAKKLKSLEEARDQSEQQRDMLKTDVAALEKQLDVAHKAQEAEAKRLDDLTRERDILTKLKAQAENASSKQLDLIKINEGTKRNLEQEIQGFRVEGQKQQRLLFQLEKEREKYGQEASESTSKYLQALEEVKLREMAIIDLQKKISEAETKFKQQQNLYEAVRVDRNMYSKKLIEAQDEIQEMKRKFKIMTHQIEQLKDEISAKDMALVKEHFDHLRVEKEKEGLRMELNKAKQQMKETEQAIAAQQAELDKLNHIINEADHERVRQKKEYDIVINERDILGTQLIRRNDELALLYEKIKIQQSALSKGQSQYRDRLNEIRVLKIKLSDLNRELSILKRSVADVNVLKREVHNLGRQLLQECTKVKALSEELENPLNVHRWRKLEGSDPSTFEMIQKIQTLQKRLISKTEEVVERDLLIQEKEKLYVELKNILARQPGPEVAEQLSTYQANMREKNKQMKSMASELNVYQAQANEYKYEIERLTMELSDMKRRYFAQKRKELAKAGPVSGKDVMKLPAIANPSQSRYMGGGFSLATQP